MLIEENKPLDVFPRFILNINMTFISLKDLYKNMNEVHTILQH